MHSLGDVDEGASGLRVLGFRLGAPGFGIVPSAVSTKTRASIMVSRRRLRASVAFSNRPVCTVRTRLWLLSLSSSGTPSFIGDVFSNRQNSPVCCRKQRLGVGISRFLNPLERRPVSVEKGQRRLLAHARVQMVLRGA